jgi:DNA polymerase-1
MVKPKKFRYMLIDGNALIHRGYHAIPVLNTKTGEQTNAVYGFTMIMLKAIKDIKPTHIACTFDLAGPTFRHLQYKEYKAQRVKADQELYNQIPRVKEVVRSLNISIFEKEGFEADDLLGTLSKHICRENKDDCEVFIVTGDLDTLQLVDDCVKIYTMRKGITDTAIYDEKAVRERYGLLPSQMVDYKALRGDPSDNIPGVKGIGEKTASDLIKEFKSLDDLYKTVNSGKAEGKMKPRVLELLKAQEKEARMSYQLSVIDCKVPVKISLPLYNFDAAHIRETVKLFQDLEFKSLVTKLPQPLNAGEVSTAGKDVAGQPEQENHPKANFKQDYQLVDTEEKLNKLIKKISGAKELAVDTETTSLDAIEAQLVGVGLSVETGTTYYVPANLVTKELKDVLQDQKIKKIGHNLKYDFLSLQNADVDTRPLYFDTMIASYLLNAGTRQHNLDTLAFNELGYQMQPIEELIGTGKKQITMDQVDPQKVSWYCCEDVDITLRLKELFEPQLDKEGLRKIFDDIEMPLVEVLAGMERAGIMVNGKFLNRLSGEAEIDIKELEGKIYKLAGREFNINSPLQVKTVLFEELKLEPVENRKNKSGLSTAAGELEKMRGQHKIIDEILQYRELSKLQNTYLEALPKMINPRTGRIHTSYQQTIAATGRLSSTDPNLQNIPIRGTGMGNKIRQAFVAAPGCELLSLDYSQIELRIVAHLAKDQNMSRVFKNNEDIHTNTAREIFNVPEDKVTPDMRRDAKTINFGILYGLSSFGLSSRIGEVGRAEAKEFITKYFKAYPQVEEYIEQVKLQVNEAGFVRNELGRVRKFPEIKSSQFFIRAAAERAAVNFPIQSLAADVIKVAMINIFKDIKDDEEVKMLLQVHDELVFEVKQGHARKWAKKLIPMMEEAIKLSVPVRVEGKVGKNWGEMEKI